MNVKKLILLSMTLFAIPSGAMAQEGRSTSKQDAKPTVSVRSFGRGKVIGFLNHPLGTVVRVQGTALDGDSTRRRIDVGKTLLQIETVNGVELERPITFDFYRAAEGINKPLAGERFDYYVHEYGEFSGFVDIPEELDIDSQPVANDGFHYRRQIAIHKENTD